MLRVVSRLRLTASAGDEQRHCQALDQRGGARLSRPIMRDVTSGSARVQLPSPARGTTVDARPTHTFVALVTAEGRTVYYPNGWEATDLRGDFLTGCCSMR
jgi:hypothetical protein